MALKFLRLFGPPNAEIGGVSGSGTHIVERLTCMVHYNLHIWEERVTGLYHNIYGITTYLTDPPMVMVVEKWMDEGNYVTDPAKRLKARVTVQELAGSILAGGAYFRRM